MEIEDPSSVGGHYAPCKDAGGAEVVAIPFAGAWDTQGNWQGSPVFTFACMTSVVAKCYTWGYRPWDTSALGSSTRARDLHQACTRMARADYCGDGHSFTKDGTDVNVWDSAGIVTPGLPKAGFSFEAAWSAGGATCMQHPRWSELWAAGGQVCSSPTKSWAIPSCNSADEAQKSAPGADLIFDDSLPQ